MKTPHRWLKHDPGNVAAFRTITPKTKRQKRDVDPTARFGNANRDSRNRFPMLPHKLLKHARRTV
jgi:hypothetical protein